MKEHFTTREVAKILDLPEPRIRSCLRAGILSPPRGPDRRPRFGFQDLLLLRTTKGLLDARVPLKRIRQIIQSLKRQLPDGQQLSSVSIYADGRRVVVWDGTARWQPDCGQFLLNFDVRAIAEQVDLPAPRASEPTPSLTAEQWFDVGCELERSSPVEAMHAYRQALALEPSHTGANINIGRLHHQVKDTAGAEQHYRAAIRHEPSSALAHFNLGVLLEECGRSEEAVAAYRAALTHDPELADAHYNLALLGEARGRRMEAITHFRAARRLYDREE